LGIAQGEGLEIIVITEEIEKIGKIVIIAGTGELV